MTHTRTISWLVGALIAAAGVSGGCSKNEPPAPEAAQPAIPSVTLGSIEKAMTAYDDVRAALANDEGNVKADALELAAAAQTASDTAPQTLREPLRKLAEASQQLGAVESANIAEARALFGEVSRAMVSLLSKAPSLQKGVHVYECPMAKGYKRWVQHEPGISNPYMGRGMPKCGTEAQF